MKYTLEGTEVDLVKSALENWKEDIEYYLDNAPTVVIDIEPVFENLRRDCLMRIDKLLEKMGK